MQISRISTSVWYGVEKLPKLHLLGGAFFQPASQLLCIERATF